MIHPRRGFYITQEEVAQARHNIETLDWAKSAFERLKQECDAFVRIPDEEIYRCVLSMKDQVFAYGITGCPHCKKPFPGDAQSYESMFSTLSELPRKAVTCPNCNTVFPNEQYPDEGQGFARDEKGYYPVGMWNFYVAGKWLGGPRGHEGFATYLTYMYMITEEPMYAHKAVVVLDAFATIFKETIGPRDFTGFGSDFEIGRLGLLTSIVHRVKIFLAHDYDWLYHFAELDRVSTGQQLSGHECTIRENIEAMLDDYLLSEPGGPEYDLSGGNLSHLQNHESDGVRAMIAVGLALDRRDYIEWGTQAVEAYLYNTIGRDGIYYEVSLSYAVFTAEVFFDIALLATRASVETQQGGSHPFANERFFQFAVVNPMQLLAQGHLPAFGDAGRDRHVGMEPSPKVLASVFHAALHFYQFSPQPSIRKLSESYMRQLYPHVKQKLGSSGRELFLTYCVEPALVLQKPIGNTVMGQAKIAVLRDQNDTSLTIRAGQNNTHGHDDALAYNLYNHGKEVSADFGYGVYWTNSHLGWLSKAIAHNTVVVNRDETLAYQQLYKTFSGGEFSTIHESENLTAIEARAPHLYGIDAYQRSLAIVPIDQAASYVADFFFVNGVKDSDFSFHAFHEPNQLELAGAVEVPTEHWTLAGAGCRDKPYFDAEGKSFGERLTTGETFRNFLDNESPQGWTTTPNNGYGYLYNLAEYQPSEDVVEAVWTSEDGMRLRLAAVCERTDRIFTATGPNHDGSEQHPFLIIRNSNPSKTYISFLQTTTSSSQESTVESVTPLPVSLEGAVGVCVRMSTGMIDLWTYNSCPARFSISTPFGVWVIDGQSGWLRVGSEGSLFAAECIDATEMTFGGQRIHGKDRRWYSITDVDLRENSLYLDASSPSHSTSYIRIRSRTADTSALYRIRDIQTQDSGLKVTVQDTFVLSKGVLASIAGGILRTRYPLPLGFDGSIGRPQRSPFSGKLLFGDRGGRAVITDVPDLKSIAVEVIQEFEVGERFDILDVSSGDEVQWV